MARKKTSDKREKKEKKSSKKRQAEGTRSLLAWHPFGGTEPWPGSFLEGALAGRFSRLLDDFFGEHTGAGRAGALLPAIDVAEDDQGYTISVELPGGSKEDVHVELEQRVLTIRGEKKNEREEKGERRRYVERSYGSFSRSFRLPGDADAERLDASFEDGVLTIGIPKTAEAKPRAIAIKQA